MTLRSRLPVTVLPGVRSPGGPIIAFENPDATGDQITAPSTTVVGRVASFASTDGLDLADTGPLSFPVYRHTHTSGALTLNRANGEYQIVTLQGNVSSVALSGWPAVDDLGRIQVEFRNTGTFTVGGWPGAVTWLGGSGPTMSLGNGKKMVLVLWTTEGGSSVLGSLVGQT